MGLDKQDARLPAISSASPATKHIAPLTPRLNRSHYLFNRQPDGLWYKDAIIYEVHVRAFFDSKTPMASAIFVG